VAVFIIDDTRWAAHALVNLVVALYPSSRQARSSTRHAQPSTSSSVVYLMVHNPVHPRWPHRRDSTVPDLGGPGPNPVDTGPIPIASDQNRSSPSTTSRQVMSMTCSLPDESLNPSLGLGFEKFWVVVEHFDLDLMVLGESFRDFEVLIYPPVLPSAYEILGSLVSSLSQNSCPSIGLVSTDPFTVHHGIAHLKPDKPSQPRTQWKK
jgi:hypothetical protein